MTMKHFQIQTSYYVPFQKRIFRQESIFKIVRENLTSLTDKLYKKARNILYSLSSTVS